MEVDAGVVESAESLFPVRRKKRPASPETHSSDGDDSSMSASIDDDWDSEEEENELGEQDMDENQGTCRPFTIEEFPRFSSDHFVQTDTIYRMKDLRRRGPSPLSLFRSFNDPLSTKHGNHWFGSQYRLYDESEISVDNSGTVDCSSNCVCYPMDLLQFVDLKIAGYCHSQPGCAKIFGFLAVRDRIDPLRNYVYRRDIDNYEAVSVNPKTGMARLSLTSPARGICITSHALLEFKLCIRTEDPQDEAKGDILIEGCTEITNVYETESFVKTGRLYGEKCGLDVTFAVLNNSVQATVDVEIVRAPVSGLNLKLYAKTSGFSDVIHLFQGVAQAGRKVSSVLAVVKYSHLDLRIHGSSIDNNISQMFFCEEWKHRFYGCYHGTVEEEVELGDFTTISVKVTWKTVTKQRVLKG